MPRARYAITVSNDTDLFASPVPDHLIHKILEHAKSQETRYAFVFYTKNPERLRSFMGEYPRHTLFATTVESDLAQEYSKAPPPLERLRHVKELKELCEEEGPFRFKEVCLSIQPIMDFSPKFVERIKEVNPDQVSIGRDVMNSLIPEPSFATVIQFAKEVSRFTRVLLRGQRIVPYKRIEWLHEVWNTPSEF